MADRRRHRASTADQDADSKKGSVTADPAKLRARGSSSPSSRTARRGSASDEADGKKAYGSVGRCSVVRLFILGGTVLLLAIGWSMLASPRSPSTAGSGAPVPKKGSERQTQSHPQQQSHHLPSDSSNHQGSAAKGPSSAALARGGDVKQNADIEARLDAQNPLSSSFVDAFGSPHPLLSW